MRDKNGNVKKFVLETAYFTNVNMGGGHPRTIRKRLKKVIYAVAVYHPQEAHELLKILKDDPDVVTIRERLEKFLLPPVIRLK